MSDELFDEKILHRRLRSASHHFFWLGLVLLILGIAAIVWPVLSTLVATLFVGWMLLLSGMLALLGSFAIHSTGPFFGALLLALLSMAGGVFLLSNPLAGEVALTVMLAAVFLVQGTFELMFALEVRPLTGWMAMLLSAITTIVLSLLIAAGWPGISLVMLGILLGVNFISTGLGYMIVSRALRRPT